MTNKMTIIIFLGFCFITAITGCGESEVISITNSCTTEDTPTGTKIICPDGTEEEVPDGNTLTIYDIPTRGQCVDLGDGVYVENEGNEADIYNNDDCDHGPGSKKVLCDDLKSSNGKSESVCWVGRRQFSILGNGLDMKLYEIDFN